MYKFALEEDPLFELFRQEIEGRDCVEFGIGFDADAKIAYRMRIFLIDPGYFAAEEEKSRQLWYGIVGVDLETSADVVGFSYSRNRVEACVPIAYRQAVFDLVRSGIKRLVTEINPRLIERSTAQGNLPFRALTKYIWVGEDLRGLNYRIRSVGENSERGGWWLHERLE